MKCKDIEELLSAYADGELERTQKEFVEVHLSGCADCRATLEKFRLVNDKLSTLSSLKATPDIREKIISQVKSGSFPPDIRMRRWIMSGASAVIIIVIILLLVIQPWNFSNTQGVMAKVYTATEQVHSYRVMSSPPLFSITLTLVGGKTISNSTTNDYSELAYVFPDKIHLKMSYSGKGDEYIFIGDKEYYNASGIAILRHRDNSVIINFVNPANLTSGSTDTITVTFPDDTNYPTLDIPSKTETLRQLDSLKELKKLADESIDGTDCYHYQGISYGDKVELWIGKADYLIRQIIKTSIAQPGGSSNIESISKFYDFNEPIDIEAPLDDKGELLPGWKVEENASFFGNSSEISNYSVTLEPSQSPDTLPGSATSSGSLDSSPAITTTEGK